MRHKTDHSSDNSMTHESRALDREGYAMSCDGRPMGRECREMDRDIRPLDRECREMYCEDHATLRGSRAMNGDVGETNRECREMDRNGREMLGECDTKARVTREMDCESIALRLEDGEMSCGRGGMKIKRSLAVRGIKRMRGNFGKFFLTNSALGQYI